MALPINPATNIDTPILPSVRSRPTSKTIGVISFILVPARPVVRPFAVFAIVLPLPDVRVAIRESVRPVAMEISVTEVSFVPGERESEETPRREGEEDEEDRERA